MKPATRSRLVIASFGLFLLNAEFLANPCQKIASACMQEGYVKNGIVGKRLIKDCVKPVLKGEKTVSYAPTDAEKQECGAMIERKMNQQ